MENDFFTGKWDGCGLNLFEGLGDGMASNSIGSGLTQHGLGFADCQGKSDCTGGIKNII